MVGITFSDATDDDAVALMAMRARAASALAARFGPGPWSPHAVARHVGATPGRSRIRIGRHNGVVVSALRLQTKKPWAIDVAWFTPAQRPLYLTDMVVDVAHQRLGLGRAALDDARRTATLWPADRIRLEAWHGAAGAGAFYERCGYVDRGHVVYKGTPLIYYEQMLTGETASVTPARYADPG